jgi:GNAT superfamily N-acetyltransferase
VENKIFNIDVSNEHHIRYVQEILDEIESSAKVRGTGIARRSVEYIEKKLKEGKAIVATCATGEWAGFCYIETWEHGKFVVNSGLIVAPKFRNQGLAKKIKQAVFELSKKSYPEAKIFGLTTGLSVMKMNYNLGYQPVTYSELPQDNNFWNGCKTCINHEILMAKEKKNCLCTAMIYDPIAKKPTLEEIENPQENGKKITWKSILPINYLRKKFKKNNTV